MKLYWIVIVILLCGLFISYCLFFITKPQLHIHLESIPDSAQPNATIYLAGNINGWNPKDEKFKFVEDEKGSQWLHTPLAEGVLEYKFTRGSWESTEVDQQGNSLPNRAYTFAKEDTLHLTISGWEDLDGKTKKESTANEQVIVWDSAMYMPQLDRYRRISIYLPKGYAGESILYPVLYMLDGQNIFDSKKAFAGEWEVDETLTKLEAAGKQAAIIVAIDHGGESRIAEYSPFVNREYGGGDGEATVRFIVETLKPKVDTTFRILKGSQHTGIMGSSLGGLVAHFAWAKYPDVFGRIGIFSPAYWFSPEFKELSLRPKSSVNPRIYILAGESEGDGDVVIQVLEMQKRLIAGGLNPSELEVRLVANGQHREWFWAQEFEQAYLWLFDENNN
ncbi:MAG: putative alpha/beta superfamily hydrolase [Cyclobacteriaceae bacterium]|jgi:predicted alpha/beta superfamily hydrolase